MRRYRYNASERRRPAPGRSVTLVTLFNAKLGCHPIAWSGAPLLTILDDIAQAGYQGTEGGGAAQRNDPATYQQELASRNLQLATVYASGAFYDPAQADAAVAAGIASAQFVKRMGGNVLCVATGGTLERRATPGFYPGGHRPDGLDSAGWHSLAEALKRLGDACNSIGVTAAFHNHVGTFVETRDELDTLLQMVPAGLLSLAPDTGHLYYGGADPVAVYRDYAARVRYMHFKDANEAAIARARREHMAQRECMAIGGFCELGQGAIDLVACLSALEPHQYAGWIMVEQDQSLIGARRSADISRAWLREHLGR